MHIFGFDVDNLTRLRVLLLPSNRTTRLEPIVDDPNAWVEWFGSKAIPAPLTSIVPVGQMLERFLFPSCRFVVRNRQSLLYFLPNWADRIDFAFPGLASWEHRACQSKT